jgi:hypothetical protein
MAANLLLRGVVTQVVVLEGEEVLVGVDLAQHDVLIVLVDLVLAPTVVLKMVLHVLETLPLEEDVQLVVLHLHYVRTLAVHQHHPIAYL